MTHFISVAEVNRWNAKEKAQFLAISLRGDACQAIRCMPDESKRNFDTLVATLTSRFNPGNRTELHRIQLKNIIRKEKETLPLLFQAQPRTLDAAVSVAVETEAFQMAEKQRTNTQRFIRGIETQSKTKEEKDKSSEAISEIERKLSELTRIIRGMGHLDPSNPRMRNRTQERPEFRCWNCGELGHGRNRCPRQ